MRIPEWMRYFYEDYAESKNFQEQLKRYDVWKPIDGDPYIWSKYVKKYKIK